MLRRLIAICGPTAGGKSAVAFALTQRLGGEIVNADSRQVYRGMAIGTATPPAAERRAVRHHLYGFVDPSEGYSLALYQRAALAACEEIWARGSFPWLVGGTGQYLWALIEGWSVPPAGPDEGLRAALFAIAEDEGAAALHARLRAADPVAAARIDRRNVRRVVRALEVFETTGRPISSWQEKAGPSFEYLLFGIDPGPEAVDERIGARVEEMFAAGFVEEVRALLDGGLPPAAPAMSSIGYREVADHIEGRTTLEETKELVKRATRRLARRQRQWFRRSDPRITWVADADAIEMQANIFTGACTNAIRRG